MIRIPKGTKDITPADSYKWRYLEKKFEEIMNAYRVREVRTPTFEHTELFARGIGDTTDVVGKEMYTFEDKGRRSITLKPEGTAGAMRAYIEDGMASELMPLKMWYETSCFRYEKPQAGRLREFHQFGIEFVGSDSPTIDAEVIAIAKSFFDSLGIKNIELFINSIGCKKCRADYNQALKDYYRPQLNEMCKDCQERFEKNPLRMLDCKEEACIEINKNAPSILDCLCDECKEHFEKLKSILDAAKIKYKVNSRIVRGLDYYSKTVFEFVSNNIGSQGTVCGGGRYDGLIEELGGKHTPSAGFGLGIERLILLLDAVGIEIPKPDNTDIYFATAGDAAEKLAFNYALKLRQKNISVELNHMKRSFKSQFKYANKINANYVIAIGDNEIESGKCNVKNMGKGEQCEMNIADFESILEETKGVIIKKLGE